MFQRETAALKKYQTLAPAVESANSELAAVVQKHAKGTL